MTTVSLHQLTKLYSGTDAPAVSDITLTARSSEIFALLGPSGSGKSTVLKMIAGLLQPTAGDICFDEVSILDIPAEKRNAVMVFQDYMLFPHMSVGENVGFGLKMRGIDKASIQQQVNDMLDRVQLTGFAARRPSELSGGQKQRVALARALVTQPRALLLDEPLSSLDAHLRDDMRQLIKGIQADFGITTILVTHDQSEAVIMANTIALLIDGQLHQTGAPADFYNRPASQAVATFFGGVNFLPATIATAQTDTTHPRAETAFGMMHIAPTPHTGSVTLTVRPEHIDLTPPPDALNLLNGTLIDSDYRGTHLAYHIAIGDLELTAIRNQPLAIEPGDDIRLQLPPPNVWTLPDSTPPDDTA